MKTEWKHKVCGLIIIASVMLCVSTEVDEDYYETIARTKRQAGTNADCSFDVASGVVDTCEMVTNMKRVDDVTEFEVGTGEGAFWSGGVPKDGSGEPNGGYIFATVASIKQSVKKEAWVFTAPQDGTGPAGMCLSFKYTISGMDMNCLSVNIVRYNPSTTVTADDFIPNENLTTRIDTRLTRLSCEVNEFSDENDWTEKKISFSWKGQYSIGFIASLNNDYPIKRGHLAIDDITFVEGPCDNDCSFDKDTCSWTQSPDDDFDFSIGRGSLHYDTGPNKDQASSIDKDFDIGGFAFIKSGWPRRPGDVASIVSPDITATGEPMCLTFWINLHGGNIGQLSVYKTEGSTNTKLWKYNGNDINNDIWNPSQLTLSAVAGSTFKIKIEAAVGEPGGSDIAIDTIRMNKGPCPRLPSGSDPDSLDCTFFDDTCSWTGKELSKNGISSSSYPMVGRAGGSGIYPDGHTKLVYNVTDLYIRFDLGSYMHEARHQSALVSKELEATTEPMCMSFWYYMTTGTAMKTTRVSSLHVMLLYSDGTNSSLWRMHSNQHTMWHFAQVQITMEKKGQIAFVGTKGINVNTGMIGLDDIAFFSGECSIKPEAAAVNELDCTFDTSLCKWEVTGDSDSAIDNWRYIAKDNLLKDHTFDGVTGGHVFIEAFNKPLESKLVSIPLSNEASYCFTFYFAAYYKDSTAELSVIRNVAGSTPEVLWSVTQDAVPDLNVKNGGSTTINWVFAQFPVIKAAEDSEIQIQGKVTMGSWTIDDIQVIEEDDPCKVRPEIQSPSTAPAAAPAVTAPSASATIP